MLIMRLETSPLSLNMYRAGAERDIIALGNFNADGSYFDKDLMIIRCVALSISGSWITMWIP